MGASVALRIAHHRNIQRDLSGSDRGKERWEGGKSSCLNFNTCVGIGMQAVLDLRG